MGQTHQKIALIGAGMVGTTVAICASRAGYAVTAVASRSELSAERAVRQLRGDNKNTPARVTDINTAVASADIILIAVNDDAIIPLADQIAQQAEITSDKLFIHFSGALASEALKSLTKRGALTASVHPMQTFPSVLVAIDSLAGSYCFCEGEPAALTRAMQLAGDMGCVPIELESDRKALYHAAACMACNYLATLQEAAIATAVLAGVAEEPARKAIAPLVAATVNNISESGPAKALTGPIARGDVKTVAAHLQALDATAPDLAELYRQLGRRTARLAQKACKIDAATVEQFMKLFT